MCDDTQRPRDARRERREGKKRGERGQCVCVGVCVRACVRACVGLCLCIVYMNRCITYVEVSLVLLAKPLSDITVRQDI